LLRDRPRLPQEEDGARAAVALPQAIFKRIAEQLAYHGGQ
jgi:hypothetical protein